MENKLTGAELYRIMKENFSKNHDFLDSDFSEKIELLEKFGIKTIEAFNRLIQDNKQKIIDHDKNYIADKVDVYRKLEGDDFVNERISKGFFFSYQALINVALEIQFPNDYALYEYVRNKY